MLPQSENFDRVICRNSEGRKIVLLLDAGRNHISKKIMAVLFIFHLEQ